ncbi:glycoside hydrolase family 32 protein [Periconia macrospinosa]|uniref:Glycoside hydrolase family 32 protein n=1 Tax=Periconia macrospinosa TaxID=97972 RepID=A0A2V1D6G7_9PLEO|nr:glycoside hydrolase family 32 protein [Periconia macrospinosa]
MAWCEPRKSREHEPRWHLLPTYHIKAPRGWLNDPCAPGYDVATGTYHLFYQWNPKSCDWGDICWGHLTSQDGVRWTYNGSEPVLQPSMPYDKEGIFTGCLYPSGVLGEQNQLTIVYSSICYLPISWTKPYRRNCAGLAAAVSKDAGRTWQKQGANPFLAGEPDGLDVIGFRDPYLAAWPAMDEIRGKKSLYGVISGGFPNEGGTVFLYAVEPDGLLKWEYLGPPLQRPLRFCPNRRWGADFGANWECASFMTLKDGSEECDFLIFGTEGGLKRGHNLGDKDCFQGWCLWMGGGLQHNDIKMQYEFGGLLDHGCFYAPSSYEHPLEKTRIVWGWIKEEDISLERREIKGWTGYLSLPRELFYHLIPNVIGALKTPLDEIGSVRILKNDGKETNTLQTLGIRPLRSLETLRHFPAKEWVGLRSSAKAHGTMFLTNSTSWELEAVISIPTPPIRIGFHIQHNSTLTKQTTIYFDTAAEAIIVDRSLSNAEDDIRKDILQGAFTLFTTAENGVVELEKLRFRIFGDGDVVELFVNDRFALSTLAYSDASECTGLSCFMQGDGSKHAVFESIKLWDIKDKVVT